MFSVIRKTMKFSIGHGMGGKTNVENKKSCFSDETFDKNNQIPIHLNRLSLYHWVIPGVINSNPLFTFIKLPLLETNRWQKESFIAISLCNHPTHCFLIKKILSFWFLVFIPLRHVMMTYTGLIFLFIAQKMFYVLFEPFIIRSLICVFIWL